MIKLGYLSFFALLPSMVFAWSGHEVRSGALKVLIEEVPEITERGEPVPVQVSLENLGDAVFTGIVEFGELVAGTHVVGVSRKKFAVASGEKIALEFDIAFGKETYSALYPVHFVADFVQKGKAMSAHAVRIVSTNFKEKDDFDEPTPVELNKVPEIGVLPLWTLRTHRVAWRYYDGAMHYKKSGWMGSDSVSRATMQVGTVTRDETKTAIQMHPPWMPGGGTIFCDYLLKLPQTKPLKLTFANAIRDHWEDEPPSDGVLFRVWATVRSSDLTDRSINDLELLYENFTDAKSWSPGEVDLSKYAGRTIILRLESHPGPNKDTTCDSSYWAEPMVIAGSKHEEKKTDSFAEIIKHNVALGRRILAGEVKPDNKLTFLSGSGEGKDATAAVFKPSQRGIVDGVLSLIGSNSAVSFDGFIVDIFDQHVIRGPASIAFRGYELELINGKANHVHHLKLDGENVDLTISVWVEGDGLRIAFDCPKRITDLAIGASDQRAHAVYYGHGYRIVNPKRFRAGFGGHNLSTSHVGCDFVDGMSVLQAVDVPPDHFEVNPDEKHYSLHSHMNGTITLVPSESGALDCAIKYRPLYDKKPASRVEQLAGRFCFDIWGGRYADIAAQMTKMIRYGLTDSILTVHVWQRWGYDYRLPDIWPPNPDFGTVEDMRELGEICRKHEIPWGLHDNYIDFYPDAKEYSYDHIAFTPNGQPIKAWYNRGRSAQSYRWRPDSFMPFLKRNLKLIKNDVAPTHYFIDVFTSIGCFDFYDREGNFHPSTETRQRWGESFAWIGDFLGNAVTTSEAGHDQLIGYLDGADCQHLLLTDKPMRFRNFVPCEDWELVPWYDAVNHHRFILHGVGYSSRYQGGRDRYEHGINSDDYISAELLEGHALMVDRGCWGRAAVRKYWLAQDVARNLALKKIVDVEMVDGEMHRQIVTWNNGTKVYVNRGEIDWQIKEHVLPQYGYLVQGDDLTSMIEKQDGVFCESSIGPSGWYCNARTFDPDRAIQIKPRIENFKYLGEKQFNWDVVWQAKESAPRDMSVFVHFYGDTSDRGDKICFQDDHQPDPPTSEWKGAIRYSRSITVAESAQGEYEVGFGIYDNRGRLNLDGQPVPEVAGNSIWIGTLTVAREGDKVVDISFTPQHETKPRPVRMNLEGKPVDFGFASTDGAFRIQKIEDGLQLTPLLESPKFTVTLRLASFGFEHAKVAEVVAKDDAGDGYKTAFDQQGEQVTFKHDGEAFCYDVKLKL